MTEQLSQDLRQIPIVCPGHSRPLAEVSYSPIMENGEHFIISACHDKLPMLRRGDTGDWIGTFAGHKGAVWSAKLDTKVTRAATASADFSVKYWNAVNGDELHTFAHKHVVKSVEFSLDDKHLYTGGYDKTLRVFDIAQPTAEATLLKCANVIRKVVVMSSPQLVLTGETDGTLRLWDTHNQLELQVLDIGASIMDVQAARDRTLVTVAAGNFVQLIHVRHEGRELELGAKFEMPKFNFREEGGVDVHPTENRFIAGGSDTWVRVFDLTSGDVVECHKGHHGPVRCLKYAPDGKSFATGSEDGTIRIWQTDQTSAAATYVGKSESEKIQTSS